MDLHSNASRPSWLPLLPIAPACSTFYSSEGQIPKEMPYPTFKKVDKTRLGERALHVAARIGNIEIVRLLPKRADVNATDDMGYTPMLAACSYQYIAVEVVRVLLQTGADPAFGGEDGCTPLHVVALSEDMDLVDLLYSRAPATLNRCTTEGRTPLFMACHVGNERFVSKLLSLGAMQPLSASEECPLGIAVYLGFVGVVRVLVNEGGIRAVGSKMPLAKALQLAVSFRRVIIVRLLLAVEEEGRLEFANTNPEGGNLVHVGAAYCYPAAVSIFLEA